MDLGDSLGRGFTLSVESIKEGFAFARSGLKNIFLYLLAAVIMTVIGAAAGALLAAIAAHFVADSAGGNYALVAAAVAFLVPFIVGLSYGFGSMFGLIEYVYLGKKVRYAEPSNVKTGFKWALFWIAIMAAIMAIFGGAFLSMATVPILGILLFMAFYLVFIFAAVVIGVVAYYAIYEGATKKKGPIDSILSSYRLLKGNFWETIVFFILIIVISYIVGLAIAVVYYVIYFMGMIMMILFPPAGFAMMGFAFLVLMLLEILMECFIMPMQVLFYKKIVDGKGKETPKKKEGEKPASGNAAEKKPAKKK